MYKDQYCNMYIECYKKIIDIEEMVKEFLYPNEYSFKRFDDNLSIEKKLIYIKKDLESIEFSKEIEFSFMENLEYFYPSNESDYSEERLEELKEQCRDKVFYLYEGLKNKYLPFIKNMTIMEYPDSDNKKISDQEIWKIALNDKNSVDILEERIQEVIWTIMDSKNADLIDKILKNKYYLDDIEFNRYIGGDKDVISSIKRNDIANQINCDFENFEKYFDDIYGQNNAISTIEKVLKRNIFLYNAEDLKQTKRKNGTLANFMFYGPTGTGKTEASKRIADFIYGDEKKLLILDMNSYKDGKIGSSAIKGHPEGYVNSEKGTDFTRFLQANRNGVIVLDEFEKADPEVREIFMTMLDEGRFKDALGNVYDLSSYIFIATTNASENFEKKKVTIGFGNASNDQIDRDSEQQIKEGLRQIFTSPIMNRFNNLIHFKRIEHKDALQICRSLLNKMCEVFENKKFHNIIPDITLRNVDSISEYILKECDYKNDGVRSLKNVINDLIGSRIIEEILKKHTYIIVDYKNDKIVVSPQPILRNSI